MNIYEAIKTLKDYCENNHVDCAGCEFFRENGCYLLDKIPEEYETKDYKAKFGHKFFVKF